MDIVRILREDYARFPVDQSFDIYASDVYFEDPVNRFRGVDRYREMIAWMNTWFQDIRLDLHNIQHQEDRIETQWTLSWTVPLLPWRPRLHIDGWTDLELNDSGLIRSHIDHWKCSRWHVVRQLFKVPKSVDPNNHGS